MCGIFVESTTNKPYHKMYSTTLIFELHSANSGSKKFIPETIANIAALLGSRHLGTNMTANVISILQGIIDDPKGRRYAVTNQDTGLHIALSCNSEVVFVEISA